MTTTSDADPDRPPPRAPSSRRRFTELSLDKLGRRRFALIGCDDLRSNLLSCPL
jgi:hypothetical protein